jgi:hypothetical protein
MTDFEIDKLCEDIWRVKNSWGLSYMEFINLSYKDGQSGGNDNRGDTVYVSPSGNELSRAMCYDWCDNWRGFSHGFKTAFKWMKDNPNGRA